MKHVIVIPALAIIGLAIGTWTAEWSALHTGGRYAGPRIVIMANRLDAVRGGAPLVASFTVRNEGGRRLIVQREQGACCGSAEQDDAVVVNPGGSATLTATLNAGGQRGRWGTTIAYTTNDPALPRFTVAVSAETSQPTLLDAKGAPVNISGLPN